MELPDQTSLYEVHHYAFINAHKITIEIKTHALREMKGDSTDYRTMAYPINSIGIHGKKEFCVIGDIGEDAVYICAEKLKDIKDLNHVFPS